MLRYLAEILPSHVGPAFKAVILPAATPVDGLDPSAVRQEVRPIDFFNGLLAVGRALPAESTKDKVLS